MIVDVKEEIVSLFFYCLGWAAGGCAHFFLTLIHVVSLPSIQVIVGRENFDRKGRRCGIGAEGGCNVSCLGHLNQNYSQ